MMNFHYIFAILSVFLAVSAVTTFSHDKSIVCNVFSQYMQHKYSLFEESDATLCTHVNCITTSYLFSINPFDKNWLHNHYWNLSLIWQTFYDFDRCLEIRRNYPHLKLYFSLNLTSHNYFEVASSPQKRGQFIEGILNYTVRYKLHGFNLNFDHSHERYQPLEKHNFIILIKEMREAFESNNVSFTASFLGTSDALVNALDYASIQKYVDFIQFTVGLNHRYIGTADERLSYVKNSTNNLIELGVSQTKIIIGIRKFCGFEKDIAILANTCLYCRYFKNWNEIQWCTEIPEKILKIKSRCSEFESARSVANQMRFLMKRDVAGVMVYALNFYDYFVSSQMAIDTFADFKPAPGVILNIPKQNDDQYPLLKTIIEAMLITHNEIYQLESLKSKNILN